MIVPTLLLLILALSAPALAQVAAFPQPFEVERQVRQTDADGSTFETPPARESYFGNHLAIVRADGSKALIDFERREYTEVDPKGGTYWSLSFSRLGELRDRIRAAEGPTQKEKKNPELSSKLPVKIEELSPAGKASVNTKGTRRLRASIEGSQSWAEAWYDASIPFGEKAVAAIESFETSLAGSAKDDPTQTVELISALRAAGKGAFIVRFEKPLSAKDGRATGKSEDIVRDWKPLQKAPVDLLKIPENFKRIPSPLETLVVFAEHEAELRNRGRK